MPEIPSLPSTRIIPRTSGTGWKPSARPASSVLAISHNANLSDGIMFPLEVDSKGRPIDAAWARQRVNNEPLTEIHQLKGTSETHPLLSPNDEFADYEILTYLLGGVERTPRLHGSYIREAWQNGLAMDESRGANPYKMGVVGASDSHNTASGYSQANYFGGHGALDATPEGPRERQGRAGHRLSVSSAPPGSAACGRKRTRARPSSRPCSGRKRSAPAACASRCGSSAAGISAPRCSSKRTG